MNIFILLLPALNVPLGVQATVPQVGNPCIKLKTILAK